ncbi:MAG: YraN family protein [Verrucomicrobiota bacterium]|jgi:putative endonuclease
MWSGGSWGSLDEWRGLSENSCFRVQFGFNRWLVNLIAKLKSRFAGKAEPENLRRGRLGELAAKKFLQKRGLKFLTANFRSDRGEIDLIFRDDDCLVFVEVKARSSGGWLRPAAAVNAHKRLRLTRCAFDYLRLIKNPPIKIRFDVVEVLLEDGEVGEVRHLPNTFTLTAPYRYG